MPLYCRCHSLDEALSKIDAGALPRGSRIVVSGAWWDALTKEERETFLTRSGQYGVLLSADHRISRHFVEVSDAEATPLRSEHRV